MRYSLLVPVLLLAFLAAAQTASQSDWSGGPGTLGPVLAWGDDFSIDTGCSWSAIPGSIGLAICVEHTIDGSFNGACCVTSDDVNGDGKVDVLGAAYDGDDIVWWKNIDGLGTTWIEHIIDESFDGASCVHSVDIDGDGNVDVLGAAYNANITWWENIDGSGTIWIEHIVDPMFDLALCAYSDDVDGDGDVDVLGAHWNDDAITWWENIDGLGTTWAEHTIDADFNMARSVYSDDVDGDGDIDVLGAGGDAICWWENADGIGTTWTEHVVDGAFDIGVDVCADDIDVDGDVDVLGAGSDEYAITWWENADGLGNTWIEHAVAPDYYGAESVCTDDIDGDGDVDVAGTRFHAVNVRWWENVDGFGTTWVEHAVAQSFPRPFSVHSDDINGDGEIDILGTSLDLDDITWWHLDAHPDNGSIESSILNTECYPDWGTLLWTAQTPPGTAVAFQVRASDNYSQMGSWSDTLTAPCSLHGILADNASYIQYRAILTTTDPDATPSLLDVTVTWNPLGTGEGEGPAIPELLPFSPNPSFGPVVVSFGLPSTTVASLSVFDVSGRVVAQMPASEYPAGYQQIQLGELPPGIYICRMRAGSFTAAQRFAVVE